MAGKGGAQATILVFFFFRFLDLAVERQKREQTWQTYTIYMYTLQSYRNAYSNNTGSNQTNPKANNFTLIQLEIP